MTRGAAARAPRPAHQADLFGTASLPGLAYSDDFVTPAEETELIARIAAANLTPFQFQQWEGKRRTRSFGWTYDFQTGRFAPGDPLPRWLEPLRGRAAAFAGLDASTLEQALIIEYGIGAGIGWPKDRPVFEQVIGISLGPPPVMRFRRRVGEDFERAAASLAPTPISHIHGESRNTRQH